MTQVKLKSFFPVIIFFLVSHSFQSDCYGWGFFAHKWIHRSAVESLPVDIRPFFEKHKKYLSEHSVDPDLWRADDPEEASRHYLDIDMYGPYPFTELPYIRSEAEKKFGPETVKQRGLAPWIVVERYGQLIEAMREKDTDEILINAAALGHYVADLHVPLHAVENYDGQLSGNDGIHKRFESVMVEKFAGHIDLQIHPAKVIADPLQDIFAVVLQSYQLSDEILQADDLAKPAGTQTNDAEFDDAYYAVLFEHAGWIAEKRLVDAVQAVGSFWYSAWLEAGKPDLN